jgi:hypothetical protein
VFIVGCLGDSGGSPEEILSIAKGRTRYFKENKSAGKNSARKIEDGARIGGWLTSTDATTSVTSKWHKGSGGPSGSEHFNLVLQQEQTSADN